MLGFLFVLKKICDEYNKELLNSIKHIGVKAKEGLSFNT